MTVSPHPLLVGLCAVCALTLAAPANGLPWFGQVVRVADGDTLSVLKGGTLTRVRLYGVDCPERGQDFGTRAKQFTSEAVFGRIVEVDPVETDRYRRVVAWVRVEGKSLNRELVRAGLAWWFRRHAFREHDLRALEMEARQNKVGLWSHPNPIPPWDFRRTEKTQ